MMSRVFNGDDIRKDEVASRKITCTADVQHLVTFMSASSDGRSMTLRVSLGSTANEGWECGTTRTYCPTTKVSRE